jgi:hypothetical protein
VTEVRSYVVEGKNFKGRDLSAPVGETTTAGRILMVPANGGDVKTVMSLPFEEFGSVAMTPGQEVCRDRVFVAVRCVGRR